MRVLRTIPNSSFFVTKNFTQKKHEMQTNDFHLDDFIRSKKY